MFRPNIIISILLILLLITYIIPNIISWYYHRYIWYICSDQDIIEMDYEIKKNIADNYWHYTDLSKFHIQEKKPVIGNIIYNSQNDIISYISSHEFKFYNNTKDILIDLIKVIFIRGQHPYVYADYTEIVYKQFILIKLNYNNRDVKYGVEATFDLAKYYEKIKNVCSYTPHGYKHYESNYL